MNRVLKADQQNLTVNDTILGARDLNLEETNVYLGSISASARIKWAIKTFGDGLFALSSAGVDSALILDHIAKTGASVPVIHINTGFLPAETLKFRDKLAKKYGFRLYQFGPSEEQIDEITKRKLWKNNLAEYSKITKLDPLEQAISQLDAVALLTGVRGDQTDNRATLEFIGKGNNDELRIRPFIDWTESMVADYIDSNKLPRNPLYKKGFGSVGDLHTTKAGAGREGREVIECGLHMVNGKLVRRNSSA